VHSFGPGGISKSVTISNETTLPLSACNDWGQCCDVGQILLYFALVEDLTVISTQLTSELVSARTSHQ
jgi:hypothetical protein